MVKRLKFVRRMRRRTCWGNSTRAMASHVKAAIDAALGARKAWGEMPWEHRAGIFLKAADLLATKYRWRMNAATMLGQSKNAYQAEIDAGLRAY